MRGISFVLVVGVAYTSFLASACSGQSPDVAGCTMDSQCAAPRVCNAGACVAAGGSGGSSGTRGGGSSSGTSGGPDTPEEGESTPSSDPAAKLAGSAWAMAKSDCKSGSKTTQYIYKICGNGRIYGIGGIPTEYGTMVDARCGSYVIKEAQYSSCKDKLGCFPSVHANVRWTLALGGEKDVSTREDDLFYPAEDDVLVREDICNDNSRSLMYLRRIPGTVTDDDCTSSAAGVCP